jgi:prepilin-type N-terminal cleavage/methylation domain-containing protein
MTTPRKAGFTLIELSIVLVIIGLLVGGILVGRDLIKAAEIRAQISQIEKYNTAVRTFQLKYGYLAGDIPATQATAFGFNAAMPRAGTIGEGDGNGILEGKIGCGVGGVRKSTLNGETVWFWVDLSANSGLISPTLNSASATPSVAATTNIPSILPPAKVGNGNYVSVFSKDGDNNYFMIVKLPGLDGCGSTSSTSLALTPEQAYSIDSKIDDGLPQTGVVKANYLSYTVGGVFNGEPYFWWAAGGGVEGATGTGATPASATTCFDNGNVGGAVQKYSVGTNGGNGLNCALSFQFQ